MPTENRSSNTEQNDHIEGIIDMVSVPRQQLQAWQQRFSKAQMFQQSTEVQAALAQPTPQPHPEPIAWMVGTAFWWTKEEAERDAAATGLPMVAIGPVADPGQVERLNAWGKANQNLAQAYADALAQRNGLLQRCMMAVREQHCDQDEADFDLPAALMADIDSALAEKI